MARSRTAMHGLVMSFVLSGAVLSGCDRGGKADSAGAQSAAPGGGNAGATEGGTAVQAARPFTPSRATPEDAANTIRELARTSWDPAFVAEYIDPSQKWSGTSGGAQTGGAPALVGPALIYFARLHVLREAAIERFGAEAGPAIDGAADFFQIDALGNGLREMFGAAKLEQVNQIGPLAYVAPLDETNEQIGASIVVRENQGEWLWVLLKGNTPWERSYIGTLSAFLAKPLEGAVAYARAFEDLAAQVRAGEFGTLSELVERVRSLPSRL